MIRRPPRSTLFPTRRSSDLMEDFYPDYRGYRYFDLRNSVTQETFSIDYVLEAWEVDKKHHEGHEGTEEWFIH